MRFSALVFTLMAGLLTAAPLWSQEAASSAGGEDARNDAASSSAPSPAQQMSHWFERAARAYQRQDIEAWVEATTELHRLRPYNQDFMRHLVEGHARLGNTSQAFEMMLTMQQQGLSVDWDAIDAVEPLREHNLYDHLNRLMAEAGEPFGDIETYATLDSEHAMPEAMALDAESGRMFIGTVRDGLVLTSTDGENWSTFAAPSGVGKLQAVFDLEVDAERGRLWVATGAVSQFQGEEREDGVRSSLLRLDLETGDLQAEYPLSSGSGRNLIGSLAVAGDGTVFAADTQSPIIYRLDPGAGNLRPFFGHQSFTSLRGMALNEDDSLLYISDYELGLFVVDVTGGQQAWQLAVPETFNAGGIDGVFFWDGHLVVIQNGITPQRLVRLDLGEDGLGVTAVAPLAAAHDSFDTPTFGVMDGSDLYFLARSHWQHVDADGEAAGDLPDVPVMTIDVSSASVRVVGQELIDRLKRQEAEAARRRQEDGEG
ncbi:MAG: hypothetical protein GVY32_05610 [Gammaproteobacteria bacterium]|jgi:sugar lactone lactonase YvrE|nr:hypothetical protein [Gammaproteobacteria bacterium]